MRTFSDGTRHDERTGGNRRIPAKLRGKARVKAAKRARTYTPDGRRILNPKGV
jgi:hypothetical protein